jgi:hypothetical protein
MAIAIGFVLRAVAGGLVISVHVSNWLLVCTMLGALFLGLAEAASRDYAARGRARRDTAEFGGVRPVLARSDDRCCGRGDDGRLHHLLREPETHAYFGTEWMVLTTPFPIYGLFRYLYLVHRKAGGGSPSTCCSRIGRCCAASACGASTAS